MLVLKRKAGQKFVIGKDKEIVITIIKVQGGAVSIGIEADEKKWDVLRMELLDEGNEMQIQDAELLESVKEA